MTCFSGRPEKPVIFEIQDIRKEARDIGTFWFSGRMQAKPGQFVMLWIPGAGMKPFGISYLRKETFGITVRKIGPFTERLFAMKKGGRVGIQGPYGRGFSVRGDRVALVGGGYGTAPLAFLADELLKSGSEIFFIIGAAGEDALLYRDRFRGRGKRVKMIYSTEDGSFGRRGLSTDCLADLLLKERIDRVCCCGPEVMMVKIFEMCSGRNIPAEFSLERYIKCGFGVCGSCVLDGTGWRVCKEGPVFTDTELAKVAEFGKYKRDSDGCRIKL